MSRESQHKQAPSKPDHKPGDGRRRHQARYDPGPWTKWKGSRAGRFFKFAESQCVLPKGYGAREPIKLGRWQKDWFEEVLGDGINAAVKSCPRQQGKTTELSALALFAVFCDDETGAPQVPIVATRVKQAVRGVYGVAVAMVKANPELADRSLVFTNISDPRIVVDATGGELFPMANNVDGLQGLDPSLAIMDEIGFQPLESWQSLVMASGKRPRSLIVGTGTPGFDKENALWHLRTQFLEGGGEEGFSYTEIAAPEGCDHTDEAMWHIANPALAAGFQNIKALRTACKMSPESHFRTFHLGMWTEGTDAWLGTNGGAIWKGLRDPYELVAGARTWVGLDVGLKRDSTACVALQRRPDGRLHAVCKIWLPRHDETVELSHIMQHLRDLDQQFKVEEIAFDPRLFELPARMLADEGLPMVEMPQSLERMTPAFGSLMEAIKRGELSHDGDAAFAQQVLAAIPRYNERGFTLTKRQSRDRIDAAYALAMAFDRATHPQPPRPPLIAM